MDGVTPGKQLAPQHGSRLPSFLVVGGQKCGTSTLHEWLASGGIDLPWQKETHFFSSDKKWELGTDWYTSNFQGEVHLRGEVDPDYLSSASAPARIKQTLGDVPIVVILREPVARAYSQYLMSWRRGSETRQFSVALAAEAAEIGDSWQSPPDWRNYLWRSLYGHHISTFTQHFSRVHIVRFDQLFSMASVGDETFAEVLKFIGLDPSIAVRDAERRENTQASARSLWLARLLWDPAVAAPTRRIFKRLLSASARHRLGAALDRLNQDRSERAIRSLPPGLERNQLPASVVSILNADNDLLRAITGDTFNDWRVNASHESR